MNIFKFYIRKMYGSFETQRLLRLENHENIKWNVDKQQDKECQILAHSAQISNIPLTHALMPNQSDFDEHWFLGISYAEDNKIRAGHHCGEIKRILPEQAAEIMLKAQVITKSED